MPDVDDRVEVLSEPSAEAIGSGPGGFLGGTSDYVNWRVYNGTFQKGPPDPAANISLANSVSSSNWMPNWRLVQSSGTAITAKQVRDTASPSGSNLRFTFASGAAPDAEYVEQLVDIGGARDGAFAYGLRTYWKNTGSVTFNKTHEARFLDVDGNTVGSATSASETIAAGATSAAYIQLLGAEDYSKARFLRLRLGVARGAASTSATGSIDLIHVRLEVTMGRILIPDDVAPQTYSAGSLRQVNGVVELASRTPNAVGLQLSPGSIYASLTNKDDFFGIASGHLRIRKIAAPAAPDTGYAIYPKTTDGRLYGKDEAGTERRLDEVTAHGARVYNSANIALGTAVETLLTFDSERFDTDAYHSTSSNTGRLTVPAGLAGVYLIAGSVRLTASPGFAYAAIYLNGVTPLGLILIDNDATLPAANLSLIYQLAVGDYVTFVAYATTASKNATVNGNYSPEFSIALLGT